MRPATLHGIGVITKLYFAIFAAFTESMTLNLAQRSFKVIDFGGNRKPYTTLLLLLLLLLLLVLKHTYGNLWGSQNARFRQLPTYGNPASESYLFWVQNYWTKTACATNL